MLLVFLYPLKALENQMFSEDSKIDQWHEIGSAK